MRQRHLTVLLVLVPSILLLMVPRARSEMSGDRGRAIVMQGAARGDDGRDRCRFSVEIERVSFLLNTVRARYKLARVRIENLGASVVSLSAARDRLDLVLQTGATVPAVLNLQSADSAFWDGLSADMRQILAYPQTIKAGRGESPGSSPEVIYVYALFPSEQITELPRGFAYQIEGLGQTIRIEHRATAAVP